MMLALSVVVFSSNHNINRFVVFRFSNTADIIGT